MGMEKNLLNMYDLIKETEAFEQGKNWYTEAHMFCRELSEKSGQPLDVVCKVVSVLSPSSYWDRNKKDALNLLLSSNKQEVVVSTYGQNKTKAISIIDGLGDLTYNSPKTYSFYRNLLDPECPEHYVTIDRHAYRAMKGLKTAKDIKSFTPKQYGRARDMFVKTAQKVGMTPCRFQSVVWVSYKKNVLNQ